MTETRLRTWTSATAYGLCAIFFAALAMQNLRFGFYELVYLAAALSAIAMGGGAYTMSVSAYQLRARGHLPVITMMGLVVVITAWFQASDAAVFWMLPLLTLAFLVLTLRTALAVTIPLILVLALQIVIEQPLAASLPTFMAMIVLLTGAALASWHYDHMAQSAEDLAITDPVTGAHNARFLDETLQKEISRAKATEHPVSVLMMDIDHHEEVRQLLGSEPIQDLYKRLAEHLFTAIRAGDSLYYLGQGRFCLILPFTPEEGARVSGERIRRSIAQQSWLGVGRMTVSVGATTHLGQDTRAERLRQRATDALSEASNRGQDSLWFHSDPNQAA